MRRDLSKRKAQEMLQSDSVPLSGVLPVVQTPFTADGAIAFGELEDEIHWLCDNGAHGVVTGMVSEILRLSSDERDLLSKDVARIASDLGCTSILSVGAESTYTAVRHARAAEAVGATGLMAIPPIATALDDDQLLGYYEAIVEATTIPLVVQDASGYVGRPMSVATQARMLEDFGDRILFKPEADPIAPKLSALRDATGGRARVFEGTGGLSLIDSYRRGIVGTMPGADLVWAISALWNALVAGDYSRAYQIHGPLVALISMQTSLDAFLAVEKYLLHKQGIFSTTVTRGPVGYVMDEESRHEVDRLFEMLRDGCELGEVRHDGR